MAAAEKKKHRLSNVFRRGKNEPPDSPLTTTTTNTTNRPPDDLRTPPAAADSAYASSEAAPSTTSKPSAENMVPVESSDERNLAMNRATGEVVDEDTGEVVTVTTTTTTTTTTTSRGGGKSKKTVVQTSSAPSPSGGGARTPVAEVPGDTNYLSPTTAIHERHDSNSSDRGGRSGPHSALENCNSIPTAGGSRVGASPMPQPYPPQQQQESPPHPIPPRNPHRKSREYFPPSSQQSGGTYEPEPVSPVNAQQHNFSYPSRSNGNLRGESQGEPRQPSTLENLKAVAVGLHGVGETLRGTLNSEIDSHYPRHNARKAAAADEKNQATLAGGLREMAGLRERVGLGTTTMTQQQQQQQQQQQHPAYRADAAPPIPLEKDSVQVPRSSGEGRGTRRASQDVQALSQTGEVNGSAGRVEEKKGGLRRLMKRKPLGAGQ